jgi:hypothetical protein
MDKISFPVQTCHSALPFFTLSRSAGLIIDSAEPCLYHRHLPDIPFYVESLVLCYYYLPRRWRKKPPEELLLEISGNQRKRGYRFWFSLRADNDIVTGSFAPGEK